MSMKNTWLTKVIFENDDIVIVFPEDLLRKLNLIENEYLSWELSDDNNIITLRKVNFVDNTATPLVDSQ